MLKALTSILSALIFGTTTNDNAAAGVVGEFISANLTSGSAVNLTTATDANITSISLTAGDWEVSGTVHYSPAATTSITKYAAGLNTVSATMPSLNTADQATEWSEPASVVASGFDSLKIGPARFSLAGTTTIFMVANSTFTVSTVAAFGSIHARRVR
jgi:hypothetical protein